MLLHPFLISLIYYECTLHQKILYAINIDFKLRKNKSTRMSLVYSVFWFAITFFNSKLLFSRFIYYPSNLALTDVVYDFCILLTVILSLH